MTLKVLVVTKGYCFEEAPFFEMFDADRAWDGYAGILGGRFLYEPGHLRGQRWPDSGCRFDLTHRLHAVVPDHPVCRSAVRQGGFEAVPKPVQRPRPPLLVGGGSPMILRMAGPRADIVSLNFDNSSGRIGPKGVSCSTAEQTWKRMAWIREGAGHRLPESDLETAGYFSTVTHDSEAAIQSISSRVGVPAGGPRLPPQCADWACGPALRGAAAAPRRVRHQLHHRRSSHHQAFVPVVAALTGT